MNENIEIFSVKNKEYYFSETLGVKIEVVPKFAEEKSNPSKNQYFFEYNILITNETSKTIQLKHRYWKIKEDGKKLYEVDGMGVVGLLPILNPGEFFQYKSFVPLSAPFGSMRGKYLFVDEDFNEFYVDVPVFFFRLPDSFIN